jgi:hypothetical protein
MATLANNIDLEIAHFENFKNHVPKFKTWCDKTVRDMLKMGIIQVSTAFEHAVAKVGKLQVVSLNEMDWCDGSDGKLTSVRLRGRGKFYSAHVSNIKGKSGKLRVQVYERIQQKFYYFVIPHKAHSSVTYLEIPFELDGTPIKKNHWWGYEVKNFKDLATA